MLGTRTVSRYGWAASSTYLGTYSSGVSRRRCTSYPHFSFASLGPQEKHKRNKPRQLGITDTSYNLPTYYLYALYLVGRVKDLICEWVGRQQRRIHPKCSLQRDDPEHHRSRKGRGKTKSGNKLDVVSLAGRQRVRLRKLACESPETCALKSPLPIRRERRK